MKVILFSGGVDSTLLAHRSSVGDVLLCCDYGQPHHIEIDFARRSAAALDRELVVLRLPNLTPVGDVFPGRNAILLSVAAGVAQSRGCRRVQIGCNKNDRASFPDCAPSFLRSMAAAMRAYGVSIDAPLLYTPRARVVELWQASGLEAWSCYRPVGSEPCTLCRACRSR